jgi:hypothetical protein
MSPRTTFLSRLLGIYSIVVSLSMLAHKQATIERVTALMHNPPVLFMAGIMALGAGLAIILSHNVWSGGAQPVIVTLVGWITLVKGLLLLFLTPEAASGFFLGQLHYEQRFYWYVGISFLLGAYLTYSGLRRRTGSQSNQKMLSATASHGSR